MPIQSLENPVFISVDGAGRANAGGTVGVYVAGTSFGTLATIYSDQVKTTELTNPITLDDAGTKELWYDVKVDIQEKTKAGVLIRDTLNLDPNATATVSTGFNLAENGSFETDSDSDGQPDSWTISPYSGSAIAITEAIVTDGVKALEFNTGAAGSGGGTATSNKFAVTEGTVCSVAWSFYATNATTLNTFQIKWYDEDDVLQSTSTLTMPASGSVPTSWTNYTEEVTADAAATQGEIVLTGIASGGSNLNSKAYFDGIKVINLANMVTLAGTQTLTNKTLTLPTIDDTESDAVLTFGETATAVNNIKITNAATGNRPTISTAGEADIGMDFENDQGEELLELVAVATAVNNIRITNATSGNSAFIDCSETNSNINIERNGTGNVLINGKQSTTLIMLETPELLVNDATPPLTATAHNSTTLNTALAVAALLSVTLDNTNSTEVYFHNATFTPGDAYKRLVTTGTEIKTQEITVGLDANYDFWYATDDASVGAFTVYLIGHYV